MSLLDSNVKDNTRVTLDSIQQSECSLSQFGVSKNIGGCEESRTFLLPAVGGRASAFNFKIQQLTLELVKPR